MFGHSLPGDPITNEEIGDIKLLNRLDQIENIVLDTTKLSDHHIDAILTATGELKKNLAEDAEGSPEWEGTLLGALNKSRVIAQGKLNDDNAQHLLAILTEPERAEEIVNEFEQAQQD